MAKIEKYLCDKEGCMNERVGEGSVSVFSHTSPDAGGGRSDSWEAYADLCAEHLLSFAQRLIGLIEDKKVPKNLKDVYKEMRIKHEIR